VLSELLGFGAVTPTVVLPAEIVLTRQRHCSHNDGEKTAYEVISPSVASGSGITSRFYTRPFCESVRSNSDISSALNCCIRRDISNNPTPEVASVIPRIWRPVESYSVESTTRRVARPRWVAVNKGDVCSLVDNLVSTMIASEDRGTGTSVSNATPDTRNTSTLTATSQPSSSCDKPTVSVTARCSIAASEPRKWKSDLLQRMQNEDT